MSLLKFFLSTKPINDEIVKNLSEIQLFDNLSLNDLEELSLEIQIKKYKKDDIIFKENEKSNGMYIIIDGGVNILKQDEKGDEVIVATLGNKFYFGEMTLIDNISRTATVKCIVPTTTYFLTKDNFHLMLKKNKNTTIKILFNLSRTLSRRLKQTTQKLMS